MKNKLQRQSKFVKIRNIKVLLYFFKTFGLPKKTEKLFDFNIFIIVVYIK